MVRVASWRVVGAYGSGETCAVVSLHGTQIGFRPGLVGRKPNRFSWNCVAWLCGPGPASASLEKEGNPRAYKLLPYLMYRADHQTGRVFRFRQERAATELGLSAKTLGLALRDLEQARCVRVEGKSGEPLRVTLTDPMALTPGKNDGGVRRK